MRSVPGTTSAYAERLTGGYYLGIEPDRDALARYGVVPGELQEVIAAALGGETVTTTVEGRERFGVIVRYPRELRDKPQTIAREVLVSTMDGAQVQLGELARIQVEKAPPVSAPKMRCSRLMSTSMSAGAISDPMSPTRARPLPRRSIFRPATT